LSHERFSAVSLHWVGGLVGVMLRSFAVRSRLVGLRIRGRRLHIALTLKGQEVTNTAPPMSFVPYSPLKGTGSYKEGPDGIYGYYGTTYQSRTPQLAS
jgi:hypothetical protein